MGKAAGAALRGFSTLLYALEFCCAAIILGVYSYYLARLASNSLHIDSNWKAVEGLSGSIVLYTIFAVLLTCFLGGVKFFAFLAIFFDVLMTGAFVAIAILTRDGASSCGGIVNTPLGSGPADENNPRYGLTPIGFGFGPKVTPQEYSPNLGLACRLNTAAFAVAIIGALLMLVSAIFQVLISRNHQKEKKYGPSPANNYTSGSGGKFWQRKPKTTTKDEYLNRDMEAANGTAAGGLTTGTATEFRQSAETGYTGTTMNNGTTDTKYVEPVATQPAVANAAPFTNSTGGYHRAPQGTAVNPYGYDNQTGTATNF